MSIVWQDRKLKRVRQNLRDVAWSALTWALMFGALVVAFAAFGTK